MPSIKLPFCKQNEFENAVKTVEMCKVERPVWGFMHPFFAPGGAYRMLGERACASRRMYS